MLGRIAEASSSLDVGTLFVIATCVTSLLGLFLLFAYLQDRIAALAWWGTAYLLGGASAAIWLLGGRISPPLPASTANVLLFVAVGMIWSAARLFHGRRISWSGMLLGSGAWLAACSSPAFAASATCRVGASAVIVAAYTFLTAIELWRERRKPLLRRWPAIFVPMLHGAIFLFPMALATLSFDLDGGVGASGWVALFATEVVLYVVGAAFIVLVLAKDRAVRAYKAASVTDPLSGLLNRRGFFEAAAAMMEDSKTAKRPVSILAFDLDHFKSINDTYGHSMGDTMLQLFANVARKTMRAGDVIGRLGGEEFVAILSGTLAEAAIAAERVRSAFEAATRDPDGHQIAATVSIGVACGSANAAIELLIARADSALYRAKANGRNRIELADEAVPAAVTTAPVAPPRATRRLAQAFPGHPVPIVLRRGA
ncbi:MAG TPA: GGDEF domain-containing protein [Xanthobacteraceae bacterium]|nr:GGDEF domain-containing protein [Xanthobacteraceae bacterium]